VYEETMGKPLWQLDFIIVPFTFVVHGGLRGGVALKV